jgi:hypothetical protein
LMLWGVLSGVFAGALTRYCMHMLGYFIFLYLYFCWLVLFSGIVYFGFKFNRKLFLGKS